jgi:hypothetical protein
MDVTLMQNLLDAASENYPAIELGKGHRLHVCEVEEQDWEVWLNTEVQDFDGLCIAAGKTRQEAVTAAVEVLELALDALQQPA